MPKHATNSLQYKNYHLGDKTNDANKSFDHLRMTQKQMLFQLPVSSWKQQNQQSGYFSAFALSSISIFVIPLLFIERKHSDTVRSMDIQRNKIGKQQVSKFLQYGLRFTLTCWERALNPKSETLRFPEASSSRFSGYTSKNIDRKVEAPL